MESKVPGRGGRILWVVVRSLGKFKYRLLTLHRILISVRRLIKERRLTQRVYQLSKTCVRSIIQRLRNLRLKTSFPIPFQWYPPTVNEDWDVTVVIAFQERHRVVRAVVAEAVKAALMGRQVCICLAASGAKDREFALDLQEQYTNIGVVICQNNPLGNKWQTAVDCARKLSPRALLITGSDDLISADYIVNNLNILLDDEIETPAMIGPRAWYMTYYEEGEPIENAKVWSVTYRNQFHFMPLGAGRIYRADFLDLVDWQIFERKWDALLDDKGYDLVRQRGSFIYNPVLDDGFVLSIKGPWAAMNPIEAIKEAPSISVVELVGEERNRIFDSISSSLAPIEQPSSCSQ